MKTNEIVDKGIKDLLDQAGVDALERMAQYRLSDAIREGSSVTDQAYAWSDEQGNVCAMSAAIIAAKARGYM